MSDVFEGPGWWMASDGRWYPPEQHPDLNYREHFASPEPSLVEPDAEQSGPEALEDPQVDLTDAAAETAVHDVLVDVTAPITFPTVSVDDTNATMDRPPTGFGDLANAAARQGSTESPEVQDTARWDQTQEIRFDLLDLTDPAEPNVPVVEAPVEEATSSGVVEATVEDVTAAEATVVETHAAETVVSETTVADAANAETPEVVDLREAPSEQTIEAAPAWTTMPEVRVGSSEPLKAAPRPAFKSSIPPSVVRAPGSDRGVEIELGRGHSDRSDRPSIRTEPTIPQSAPTSTSVALVPVEEITYVPTGPTGVDRFVAGLAFVAGVLLIVGTFLPWVGGIESEAGWERPDGIFTVIAGVLGASAAGPIWIGYRKLIPILLTLTGLVAAVVGSIAAFNVLTDGAEAMTSIAIGLVIVIASALALIFTGLASRETHPR